MTRKQPNPTVGSAQALATSSVASLTSAAAAKFTTAAAPSSAVAAVSSLSRGIGITAKAAASSSRVSSSGCPAIPSSQPSRPVVVRVGASRGTSFAYGTQGNALGHGKLSTDEHSGRNAPSLLERRPSVAPRSSGKSSAQSACPRRSSAGSTDSHTADRAKQVSESLENGNMPSNNGNTVPPMVASPGLFDSVGPPPSASQEKTGCPDEGSTAGSTQQRRTVAGTLRQRSVPPGRPVQCPDSQPARTPRRPSRKRERLTKTERRYLANQTRRYLHAKGIL